MHHHSQAMKVVSMITWLVTALAALLIGIEALGVYLGKSWSFWHSQFVMNNLASLIMPLHLLIGVCGLISLITWITCLGSCCTEEHHKHDHRK